jgi:hypothetical protein
MNILPVHRLLSIINPVEWSATADTPRLDCDILPLSTIHDKSHYSMASNDIDSSCYNNGAFVIGPYDDDGDEG